MSRTYKKLSNRDDSSYVYFGKEGDYGWKLDVQDSKGSWSVEFGDQVETYLDEILPYLFRFIDNEADWENIETGEKLTFWQILRYEFESV